MYDFSPGISDQHGRVRRDDIYGDEVLTSFAGYRFDDRHLAGFGAGLTAGPADVVDIAGAISLADGLSPRPKKADRWSRQIAVTIPVRQECLLASESMCQAIARWAMHLTGDAWTVDLVPRRAEPRRSERQLSFGQLQGSMDAPVVLHSGGLDSLLGLLNAADDANEIIGVSAVTNTRQRQLQASLILKLHRVLGVDFHHTKLEVGFVETPRSWREKTQRARSGLYLALGAATALLVGHGRVSVFENGIGAINLPVSHDQFSTQLTRAMHPLMLAETAELFSQIAGADITIANEALLFTKGELGGRYLRNQRLYTVAENTVSCDRFPWLQVPCGTCTSCLLRESALFAVNHRYHTASSQESGFVATLVNKLSRNQAIDLFPFYAVDNQVHRLHHALSSSYPESALVQEFPVLVEAISGSGLDREAFVRLYKQYAAEWTAFREAVYAAAGANLLQLPSPVRVGKIA